MNRRELMHSVVAAVPAIACRVRNHWGDWGEPDPRGERLVMINPHDIVHAFSGPHEVLAAKIGGVALPADVAVRDVQYDYTRQVFLLRCSSREWTPVPLGEVTPMLSGDVATVGYKILTRRADGLYAESDL